MTESKAKRYLQLAQFNADLFSKDPHTKVGAIFLSNDFSRILSTGINGFPRGLDDNLEYRWERPLKYSFVCHAESNGIANAARTGTPLDSSIVITTKFPCSTCSKLLIQAGVTAIYCPKPNPNEKIWGEDSCVAVQMLEEVKIQIHYL
jgi:dCMP deaminase